MEGIIFAIIVFIISSFFNKGNKDKQQEKPMPPFSNQKVPPSKPIQDETKQSRPKVQSLEDFATEIFGQLNDKQPRSNEPVKVEQPALVVPEARPTVAATRVTERPKLGETRPIIQKARKESLQVVPRTQKELMQAVIAAEILGPPKAKQRKI